MPRKSAEDAFLDNLHSLLKLIFESIFALVLGTVQTLLSIYSSTSLKEHMPWLNRAPPSRSSAVPESTPTKVSVPVHGSTPPTYLLTSFQSIGARSVPSLKQKANRNQIAER